MKKIDKDHNQLYDQFIAEYSEEYQISQESVDDSVDYMKAVDTYFPQIEVYFKNGKVYTVNQKSEKKIAWAEGNDFLPGQTGFNDRNAVK